MEVLTVFIKGKSRKYRPGSIKNQPGSIKNHSQSTFFFCFSFFSFLSHIFPPRIYLLIHCMSIYVDFFYGFLGFSYTKSCPNSSGGSTNEFFFKMFEEGQNVLAAFVTIATVLRRRKTDLRRFIEEATGNLGLLSFDGVSGQSIIGHNSSGEGFSQAPNKHHAPYYELCWY